VKIVTPTPAADDTPLPFPDNDVPPLTRGTFRQWCARNDSQKKRVYLWKKLCEVAQRVRRQIALHPVDGTASYEERMTRILGEADMAKTETFLNSKGIQIEKRPLTTAGWWHFTEEYPKLHERLYEYLAQRAKAQGKQLTLAQTKDAIRDFFPGRSSIDTAAPQAVVTAPLGDYGSSLAASVEEATEIFIREHGLINGSRPGKRLEKAILAQSAQEKRRLTVAEVHRLACEFLPRSHPVYTLEARATRPLLETDPS